MESLRSVKLTCENGYTLNTVVSRYEDIEEIKDELIGE